MFTSNNLERVVTAVLAIILVIGTVIITAYNVITGKVDSIPQWLQTASGLALGYYFGIHLSSSGTNGGVKNVNSNVPTDTANRN